MKKVSLIIQARMGSVRLPGKSMLDLAGEPLIFRLVERVKRCKNIEKYNFLGNIIFWIYQMFFY